MAYNRDRDDDSKPQFGLGRFSGEGNMTADPKDISKGDSPFVSFKVAFNSRNHKQYEGSWFVNVLVGGSTAERVLADGHKGKRVHVEGTLFMDEPFVDSDDNERQSFTLRADSVSESWRFADRDGGGSRRRRNEDDEEPRGRSGSTSRRNEDDDEEPRGRSARSSRRNEDDEEPRGRSARSSRRSEEEEADEPRSSRRSSRRGGEDKDEPRSGRSRRSRGSVEENGDDVED